MQEEENLAAQQAQEEQSGRGRRENQPFPSPVDPHQLPPTSSNSRQVERHESQRTKNVRLRSGRFSIIWALKLTTVIPFCVTHGSNG